MELHELQPWELLQKKLTIEQLDDFEGKTILDFGCGNGVMSAYYAKKNKVVAVEPDELVLKDNPYPNVTQIHGDVRVLQSFENHTFDVIICHNVLEYTNNPTQIVKEFERLLKNGGILSILKHNVAGRIMQMAVLLDNFEHAHELLNGKTGQASQYGTIHYYEDKDLIQWTTQLKIRKILGMRTFFDLQQNQQKHTNPDWQKEMLALEQRVADIEAF